MLQGMTSDSSVFIYEEHSTQFSREQRNIKNEVQFERRGRFYEQIYIKSRDIINTGRMEDILNRGGSMPLRFRNKGEATHKSSN
jgi:hypothetical protein